MLLTIITTNLNNLQGLQKTFTSVFFQTFTDFEYIVIDGASKDGSLDLIKRNQSNISYWQSQQDRGIFDAMNKGIALAKGEYCLFLNSGDSLHSAKSLEDIFAKQLEADIIYGDAKFIQDKSIYYIINYPDILNHYFLLNDNLCHQATFIKRSLFKKYGPYDESYKISSDWLFFLKTLLIEQVSYQHIKTVVVNYDLSGISSKQQKLVNGERAKILHELSVNEGLNIEKHAPDSYKFRIRMIDRIRNKFVKEIRSIF